MDIYKKYTKKLIQMGEEDQKILKNSKKINSNIIEIQKNNTEKLKKIIKKMGYPKPSIVGKKVSMYTWLIVQHSDFDISFQEEVLNILKTLSEKKEDVKMYIAYLEDRILINKHLPQIYGTQAKIKGGKLIPFEIIDMNNVDKRRKRMGLDKLENYLKSQ